MRKKIIVSGLVLLSALVFYLIYSYSLIQLSVSGVEPGKTTEFTLSSANSEQAGKLQPEKRVTKLVKRGHYEVLVRQGEKSYIASVTASGFLRKARVVAKLAPEKSRTFIGNNPGSCMYLISKVLFSQPCTDTLNNLSIHVPANKTQPTYTKLLGGQLDSEVLGISDSTAGSFVLVKTPGYKELTAYPLSSSGRLGRLISLPGIPASDNYSLINYKDGFLLFDETGSSLAYYSAKDNRLIQLSSRKPEDKSLNLHELSARGEQLLLTFSQANFEDPHSRPELVHKGFGQSKKETSELIVLSGESSKHFSFPFAPYKARLCDVDRLCVLRVGGQLEVYDVSGPKQKLLYNLPRVLDIENSASTFLIVTNIGVARFDVMKREGHFDYSFWTYLYSSLKVSSKGLVLALVDNLEQEFALLLSASAENEDSIDKRIARLQRSTTFKDISVYGMYVFISPDVGEVRYLADKDTFGYSPIELVAAKEEIRQKVKEAGIDTSRYTIINTLD